MLSLRQLVADTKHAVAEQAPEDQEISQENLLLRTADYSETPSSKNRLPSPQRGRGAGGEGDSPLLNQLPMVGAPDQDPRLLVINRPVCSPALGRGLPKSFECLKVSSPYFLILNNTLFKVVGSRNRERHSGRSLRLTYLTSTA